MDQQSHEKGSGRAPSPAKSARVAGSSLFVLILVSGASISSLRAGVGADDALGAQEEAAGSIQTPPEAVSKAPKRLCEELDVKVVRTGKFDGAKLRATPGFEHEQAGIVTRGAHLVVCETATTPGTKIPNVWYRIHEGKHEGLWIHKQVLKF